MQVKAPNQTASLLSEYWNRIEMAREFHVCLRTFARMEKNGSGPPFVKRGRRKLYKKSSVINWLQMRERPSGRQSRRGGSR
jgi:hypothetical protein